MTPVRERLVFFDLETTGLDPVTCQITQIAAVATEPPPTLKPLFTFEVKLEVHEEGVRALESFPESNYDPEVWEREAVSQQVGLRRFGGFLESFKDARAVSKRGRAYYATRMAGYNISKFDIPFLKHHMKEAGVYCAASWLGWDILQMAIAYSMISGEHFDSYTLGSLTRDLDVPLEDAHDAMADVKATLGVAFELSRRMGGQR